MTTEKYELAYDSLFHKGSIFREEFSEMAFEAGRNGDTLGICGLFDKKSGECIDIHCNKFLRRGLFWLLENSTQTIMPASVDGTYNLTQGRIPLGIRMGTGGSTGTQAITVNYTETQLASAIPFKRYDSALSEAITPDEALLYFNSTLSGTITSYWAKRFSEQAWSYDDTTELVGKKFTTDILAEEADGSSISEIGMVIGTLAGDNITVTNIEQVSRVTFASPNPVTDTVVAIYTLYLTNVQPTIGG